MLKDVTNFCTRRFIDKVLSIAIYQYVYVKPFYMRYQKVYFNGMTFFVSLNTKKVYIGGVSIKDLISKFDNKNGSKING